MSYDVRITMTEVHDDCPNCGGHHTKTDYDGNLTYNVSSMIRRAGVHPAVMNGMNVELAEEVLSQALFIMTDNRAYFEVFEPDNGWGTVETTVKFIRELLAACEEADSDATVRWS